jgi:poly(3-hydroxybutyrate) depolymerase
MTYLHSRLFSCFSLCLPAFIGCSTETRGRGDTDSTGTGGQSPGEGTGGSPSGGLSTGGSGTGGSGTGGGEASGGAAAGGSTGENGSGGDGASDVVPSNGCNVQGGLATLTAGGQSVGGGLPTSTRLSIDAGTSSGEYIIDIPADYDPTHPYRLIFSWHQAYGSANGNAVGQYPANNGPNFNAENYAFFGLHRESVAANDPVIIVAPQGIGNLPWNYDRDVVLFDEVLAHVSNHLCIDESRVFTTGFSFGAMMSHALSLGRASKLRGAVTMAPANWNFTQPTKDGSVAYFGITGMSDGTCSWVNNDGNQTGGKYCVLTHAEDNGCTIPGNIQTAPGGSNQHLCYEFEGCDEGHPVKVCTFDGAHTPSSVSNGMSGDDGLHAFVPPLAWDFISQL